MKYQELFQCLKGVGDLDLSSLCLPVEGTAYGLFPINCQAGRIDDHTVRMLTEARNSNSASFLTYFTATTERTAGWLAGAVARDPSRILFSVSNIESNYHYGYMGLAYGDPAGIRIEGDAIVRFAEKSEPGLMRSAFLCLVNWAKLDLGIGDVWVRVLSDNPAVGFYKLCAFSRVKETTLYETRGRHGELVELSETPTVDCAGESSRTLVHMRYSP